MRNILIAALVSVFVLALVFFGFSHVKDFSALVSELSKVGVVVLLPGFFAWANLNLSGHVRKINSKICSAVDTSNGAVSLIQTDIGLLNASVKSIETEIKKIRDVKDIKAKYRRDLLNTQDMCLEFMSHDDSLVRFASLRADSFRQFVMDIHDMAITPDCVDSVERLGANISAEIRIKGYNILGGEFMDSFHNVHVALEDSFLSDVCRIFMDPDNSKHERFQEHCLKFLKSFLSELNKSYVLYVSKKPISE